MTLDEARQSSPNDWDRWLAAVRMLLHPTPPDLITARKAFAIGLSPLKYAVNVMANLPGPNGDTPFSH